MSERTDSCKLKALKEFAMGLRKIQHHKYPQTCIIEGYLHTGSVSPQWKKDENYSLILQLERSSVQYKEGSYFSAEVKKYLLDQGIRLTDVTLTKGEGCIFITCDNCYLVL